MSTHMPIGPLLELCPHLTHGTLADRVGIDRRVFDRAVTNGQLRWDAADVAAIRLGSHPAVIWPDEWVNVPRQADYHGARRYLNRLEREAAS